MCIRDSTHTFARPSPLDAAGTVRSSKSSRESDRRSHHEARRGEEERERGRGGRPVSYTHLRAHETSAHL
eukprot:11592769-Alexandrium_andersonii.AAC.1